MCVVTFFIVFHARLVGLSGGGVGCNWKVEINMGDDALIRIKMGGVEYS